MTSRHQKYLAVVGQAMCFWWNLIKLSGIYYAGGYIWCDNGTMAMNVISLL